MRVLNADTIQYIIIRRSLLPPLDLATSGREGIDTYVGICLIGKAFGVANAYVMSREDCLVVYPPCVLNSYRHAAFLAIACISRFLLIPAFYFTANELPFHTHLRLSCSVYRGLDSNVIESFPTFTYSTVNVLKIEKGSLECAVCLSEFRNDDKLRLLPQCNHAFHSECIDKWLSSRVTCPVCRANLREDSGAAVAEAVLVDILREANDTRSYWQEDAGRFGMLNHVAVGAHSLHPPESYERFTLRLPEDVQRETNSGQLNRAASCTEKMVLLAPYRANMQRLLCAGSLGMGLCSHGIACSQLRITTRYHPSRVLTLVYQPFALGTIALLTYYEARLNTRRRNLGGYTLFFISSLLVIVVRSFFTKLLSERGRLDLATSGRGGIGTYVGICAISGAFGIADAHVQGGMLGDLSLMRPEFIQLACVLLYAFVFPKLEIVKYYRSKAASEGSKTVSADLAAAGVLQDTQTDLENPKDFQRFSNKQLLIQNIDYAIDLYLIYVLTLSIFPGFLYEDTGYGLVLVASYNVSDLIGRYIPLIKTVKITSRYFLTIACLSRFLLIPAFYFTAKYGDQGWMIMLTSILGLTNGHLTVCILTEAPKGYKAEGSMLEDDEELL
ncbi:Equilibrative nucleotide transporter 3 [Nymphaea thermarum]|nr:Equilibrative nucleotide transporter 3 [Nymphaea thermarum]